MKTLIVRKQFSNEKCLLINDHFIVIQDEMFSMNCTI